MTSTSIGLTTGSGTSITSTVVALGSLGYISSASLTSTVQGLGQIYLSSGGTGGITTSNLVSTVQGLGTSTYISSLINVSNVSSMGGSFSSVNVLGSISTNTMIVNSTLDVYGPAQSGVYFSTVTSARTINLSNNPSFGVFYYITGTGTYPIVFNSTQPSSNIGRYNAIRNCSGADITLTITGATFFGGLTAPTTCSHLQTLTFMIATTTTYALF